MEKQAFEALEFDKFRQLIARYAQTPIGQKQLLELEPLQDIEQIRKSHLEASECISYQQEIGHIRISEIKDPTEMLMRLGVANTRLDTEELLDLQSIISIGNSLRQDFREVRDRFKALGAILDQIPNLTPIYNKLRATLLPSGEVNEDASPELRRIRREIGHLRSRIYRQLESLIDQAGSEGTVRDEFVTVRNGRFVIPVRSELRGRVPGVVHGLSSSGATAFVEPLSTIEENNELVRLKELESEEIAKILFQLSEMLRKELPAIKIMVKAIEELDLVVAKANFAEDYSCTCPQMNLEGRLEVLDARHPLLEHNLRHSGGKVVPISLKLSRSSNAMVISGPNAGGKTVVLKTVGLLALIAQSGLHIPARDAVMPIFASVLADIGDHQSIAANLSTFSSHISNIREMVEIAKLPSLVMLDEVGTGTDPEEGAALGVAIVDYFKQKGSIVLVSTHYNPLKYYATQTEGVVNASVEFDEKTLRPTYRLLTDIAGTSSGIEIARRLGLQEEILQIATKTLDHRNLYQANFLKLIKEESEHLQQLTAALEDERRATAAKYHQMETEFALREQKRQKEIEQSLLALIKEFENQVSDYISQIKDPAVAAKLSKEREKRLFQLKKQAGEKVQQLLAKPSQENRKVVTSSELLPPEFSIGDRVETELGQQGVVEGLHGDEVSVRIGNMRFRTRTSSLKPAKASDKKGRKLPQGVNLVRAESERDSKETFTSEINVIGCLAEEACDKVDKFLDKAYLASYDRVRVIHGAGTGKLRRAIGELLHSHPHVAKFYQATSSEGGIGATIVELRQ